MSQTNPQPRLSVAILVRNAEAQIERTLESIKSIADEIVVLDTGSVDGTLEIVQKYDVQLFQTSWLDDFSAARNECLSRVCGDWVLWLDAGEYLEADNASQLREFLNQQADSGTAYMMIIKTPVNGQDVSGEQIARVRLAPTHPAVQFEGRVRESLGRSLAATGIDVQGLPFRIHRGEYDVLSETKAKKAKRNIRIADLEIKETGPSSRLLNCLGDAFQTLNDKMRGSQFYRHALESSERGSVDMLEAYYGLLTTLDGTEDAVETQLAISLEALEIFPLDSQLLCAMGGYLQMQGRLDLAARSYETAYKHGQIDPQTWHLDQIQEIAAVCLSLALQLQKQEPQALEILEEAVGYYPKSVRLHRQLMEYYIKQGDRDKALAQMDRMPQDVPHREALRSVIRGACLANAKNWIAARSYLETGFQAGCRDPLCLRWLTVTLLSTGDLAKAEPILAEWNRLDPTNVEVQKYLEIVSQRNQQAANSAGSSSRTDTAVPAAPMFDRPHTNIDLGQTETTDY
ncbi:MAG: tetratricopeptide (TPR) repeat protein [Pirellulaceae bacterium]|jgi:tetratricopeptide (TPR) repeat protein